MLLLGARSLAAQEAPIEQRVLAPGVLRIIPSDIQIDETFTGPMPLVEITSQMQLNWQPFYAPKAATLFARAQETILRREIWGLEFAFKPLRMMEIDVPQPSGKMQRKLIWYMVYRVRYVGNNLAPKPVGDGFGRTVFDEEPTENPQGRYFFPRFVLESHEFGKVYQDRIVPAAMKPIERREKPSGPLYNSVTITQEPIPLTDKELGGGVWGVAIWEDVDPRIDYFSIYVSGLTNAYQPVDVPNEYQAGDPPGTGRQLLGKTLRLNFWRPGDVVDEAEDMVRFGVPVEEDQQAQQDILNRYGLKEHLDYEWVYR